jgi:hypothetical protein
VDDVEKVTRGNKKYTPVYRKFTAGLITLSQIDTPSDLIYSLSPKKNVILEILGQIIKKMK